MTMSYIKRNWKLHYHIQEQNIGCLEYSLPYPLNEFSVISPEATSGDLTLELIQRIWQAVFQTIYVLFLSHGG